ncbi:MAG: tetratricopeptide repeat protein [Pseudomonadota bacterium]
MRNKNTLRILFVLLIPLVLFSTNLDGTWILDDHYQVAQNPYIRSFEYLPRILTTRLWQSTSMESQGSDIFRPVFLLSYMVDYHLFGANPFWFHLVNNLLHAINCLLLFTLTRKFLTSGTALFATLLFAVHPIGVEAVTWIAARTDLLAAFFALANVHMIVRILDRSKKPGVGEWILFALTIPFAFFSKEISVLVPFLTIVAVAATDDDWKAQKRVVAGLFGTAGVLSAGALWFRQSMIGSGVAERFSLDNLKNTSELLKRFLFLFVVPADTDFFNAYPYVPFHWKNDLPLIALFAIAIAFVVWRWRRNRAFLLGVALFLAPLIPVSLAIDRLGLLAERYFYLPLAGFSLALAVGSQALLQKNRKIVVAAVSVWLLLLSGVAVLRNRQWHDEVRLYGSSIARHPDNYIPHFYLGWHYYRTGEKEAEIRCYYETLRRNPTQIIALNNLGVRLIERDRHKEAEELLRRALEVDPTRAKTYYNLGYLRETEKNFDSANTWYRKALELDPSYEFAKAALARMAAAR